jgi:hypothetical protein
MNLPEQVARGAEAHALLENPFVQEAFASVQAAIIEQWTNAPLRDREGAHELKLMLKLLNDLKSVFELAVHDGREAGRELDRLNSKTLSPRQWMNR